MRLHHAVILTPPMLLRRNSHGIISFTDPHPLTLLESYRFKNMGGRAYPQRSDSVPSYSLTDHCPLTAHSCFKSFRCNTYKKPGGPLPARHAQQIFFHGSRDDLANTFAQRRHILFGKSLGLDGIVQMNRNLRRPQHPMARPVMLKGAHQTYRHDRNAKLLRHAKAAVLKLTHLPVARPPGLRKNDQAGAAVDRVLREPPHTFQVRRPPHIRDWDVAEALHQPAVRRNLEMGFQLPSAHKLRDRAVQHKRVEKVDVIGHEETCPQGVETAREAQLDLRAGKKRDAFAEGALQPIVFAGIEKNSQEHQRRRHDEKMQAAEYPQNRAADRKPGLLHMKTSTAAGRTSSARHSTVTTSPSIMTSTGAASLNSTWRTARREASG